MLDVKKTLAKLLKCDYVIEDGSYVGANGELRYRKWAHGTLEISVFLHSFNLTNYASASGWNFYSFILNWNNLVPITFPNFINTHYTVTHSWVIGSAVASPNTILSKATNQLTLYGMSFASGSQLIQLSVELKGRWK